MHALHGMRGGGCAMSMGPISDATLRCGDTYIVFVGFVRLESACESGVELCHKKITYTRLPFKCRSMA